jgi:sugar lactone lactonase YvrE
MSKRIALKSEILIDGLLFPECPRWRDNKLWFSDMEAREILTSDMTGNVEFLLDVPNRPSGLGWLPDGTLVIVSMEDRKLLRFDSKSVQTYADLSKLATYHLNDMVIDDQGRAYVGNFGFDYFHNAPFVPAELILVSPNGDAKVIMRDMAFPNGSVITPDNKTFIVGETFAARLTAFDIEKDGSLTGKRIWANLKSLAPDGICLDEKGGIWVTAPGRGRVVRVLEGGMITHIVKVENDAYACILGGPDRKTLFIATSTHERNKGRIEFVQVEYAGAGLP